MKKIIRQNKEMIVVFIVLVIFTINCLVNSFEGSDALLNFDTITTFFYILCNSELSILNILGPICVIIASTKVIHNEIHSGMIKNYLVREDYGKYIKKVFLTSLKGCWILPAALLVLFIGCYMYTKSFDVSKSLPVFLGYAKDGTPMYTGSSVMVEFEFYNYPIRLMITFFVVLIIHSIFYTNIGLIVAKKNKNFIISVVVSLFTFIALDVFSEIILKIIIIQIFGHKFGDIFNLMGIYVYSDFYDLNHLIIYSLIILFVSYLVLFLTYKDKERLINNSER